MNKTNFQKLKEKMLQDPETKKEYSALEEEYKELSDRILDITKQIEDGTMKTYTSEELWESLENN